MSGKEMMDLILSKVPEDRREAFVAEIRRAETAEDRKAVLERYGVELTTEEKEAIRKSAGN